MKPMASMALAVLLATGVASGQEGKDKAMEKNSGPKITGQCHCGFVKYEASGPVVKCSYCDCRGCQRASGTLKVPFVTMLRTKVKLTAGELAEFRAKAGEKCDRHGVWLFCPKCGTQVFWKGNTGEDIDIFAGTLDDTKVFKPKE